MNSSSYFQLLNPIILLVFAAAFYLIRRNAPHLKAAGWLTCSYAMGAVGFLLDMFARDAVGPYWGAFISNVPFVIAMGMLAIGISERFGARVKLVWPALVFASTFVGVAITLMIDPFGIERALVMNVGTGAILALCLPSVFGSARNTIDRLLKWVLVASVVQFAARPLLVIAFVGMGEPAISYSGSVYALTLHFTTALMSLSIACIVLFMLAVELVDGLAAESRIDPLTGLLNRRGLDRRFKKLSASAASTRRPVGVIVTDIDHFKSINDRYGHASGDVVIRRFAELLACSAVPEGLCARIGGEEFVVVLPGADANVARLAAEGMRTAFATMQPPAIDGRAVTASFGVAEWSPGASLDDIVRSADKALYEAKARGRNQVFMVASEDSADKDINSRRARPAA